MRAFHNLKTLKEARVKVIKDKIANGQLRHGTYGERDSETNKMVGCAVFLTTCKTSGAHSVYPTELGILEELAHCEDTLFEGLRDPHDKEWPIKFLEAIPVGADLSMVAPRFKLWLVQENLKHEALWRKHDKKDEYTTKVVDALGQVKKVIEDWIETGKLDESAAWSARSAAWSAWSARSAAWSAWSAESAARSAEDKFYIRCSEKLLQLLSEAPVTPEVDTK